MPAVLLALTVIAGGELAGMPGIVFAVPTLAVVRVLYDFFRVRLRVAPGVALDADEPPTV